MQINAYNIGNIEQTGQDQAVNNGSIQPAKSKGFFAVAIEKSAISNAFSGNYVNYDKNGNGGSVPGHFVFNATARKTFLPGMSYSFEFTLKFFGDFKETELTLGILEFTEIKNVTDPVGGE